MSKSSAASQDALERLHNSLVEALVQRIADGTASAADLSVAAKLLKDNGITAEIKPGNPLDQLAGSLPFPSVEGVETEQETHH